MGLGTRCWGLWECGSQLIALSGFRVLGDVCGVQEWGILIPVQ